MDVYDKNDVVVGIISDLVLDTEANDVFYAVMTPAGVLEERGLGQARFPVPLRAFQFLGDRLKLPRAADFIRKAPPIAPDQPLNPGRSEEHTSELQSRQYLVCRLLLEKKKTTT